MIPWAAFERRWLDALLAAMIPPSAARPGLGDLDLAPFHAELGAAAPPLLRLGVRTATWVLTFAPPLLVGRLTLFGGLSPADRDRLLVRAYGSRSFLLRQLALTVKLAASFGYFRDPRARALFPGGAPTP